MPSGGGLVVGGTSGMCGAATEMEEHEEAAAPQLVEAAAPQLVEGAPQLVDTLDAAAEAAQGREALRLVRRAEPRGTPPTGAALLRGTRLMTTEVSAAIDASSP